MFRLGPFICALALVMALAPGGAAARASFQILHHFTGGSDGATPEAEVIGDGAGNIYGTTTEGGTPGLGTVFKIASDGTETVLHAFKGSDGSVPRSQLLIEDDGSLVGTTLFGGKFNKGVIYRLGMDGKVTVLHDFSGAADGFEACGPLLKDADGAIYGTTISGGDHDAGTVFKLTPDGEMHRLYSFFGFGDGRAPFSGVIADKKGNLFGTTEFGGLTSSCENFGCGVVFEVSRGGLFTVLYTFKREADGGHPYGRLYMDKRGNLFGAAEAGGDPSCLQGYGCGVIYEILKDGPQIVRYTFPNNGHGMTPRTNLAADKKGIFYGTTAQGGTQNAGVIFALKHQKSLKTLYNLSQGNVSDSRTGLWMDAGGAFYGTTRKGGNGGMGVVFKFTQ